MNEEREEERREYSGALIFYENEEGFLFEVRSPKEDDPGKLGAPGGGVEDGETPRMTAKREIHEELGIQIPEKELVKIYQERKGGKIGHAFYHTLNQDPEEIKFNDEVSEIKFLGLNEIYENLEDFERNTRIFYKRMGEILKIY